MRPFAAALLAGLFAAPFATAEPNPKVADALKKAGDYLRNQYSRADAVKGKYGLGEAALGGLGMMEAGVPENDPAVQNVAKVVRNESLMQTDTYHISLSIIFLDRLGDRGDVPLIQVLGTRLYAGMNAGGGWTYKCWSDVNGADALLKSLQTNELTTKDKEGPKDPKGEGFLKPDATAATANGLHPVAGKLYADVSKAVKNSGRGGSTTGDDNSNTQFGIVGLWVAARNGVPAKDAFALLEARFSRSQNADGGWGYEGVSASTVSMTCAGLLGLAVGRASREVELTNKKAAEPPKDMPQDDPFYAPKKGDGQKGDTLPTKEKAATRSRAADAGLRVLGGFLAAAKGGRPLRDFTGIGTDLYMLWSVERACVAYGLETLGGVDWHEWGVGYLLQMQGADGSFNAGMYPGPVDTTFAVLFLAKSNFTRELSSKKGIDPGKGELRGGGGLPPLLAQKPKDGQPTKPQGGPKVVEPDAPVTGGFTLPKVAEPTAQGEAEKVSKGLIEATEADWLTKLGEARDGKGPRWTRGLVLACGRLDGDRRLLAREALAERLTRMTAKTLREMMQDPELELRRGACLAAGMKDELELAPALIERLTDPAEYVVKAARASLKSLANGQDFGPTNAGDEDARLKAAAQWKAWYERLSAKK